jgi:hypothetical protein
MFIAQKRIDNLFSDRRSINLQRWSIYSLHRGLRTTRSSAGTEPRPNKYTVRGASASLEVADCPSVLHVPTEHGVSAPRLCLCFNGLGVHVPPGHVRH